MRIVHCLNYYLPGSIGGCEVYTHALALAQKKAGHEVFIVLPFIRHYTKDTFIEGYDYEGIQVRYFDEPGNPLDKALHSGNKTAEGIPFFIRLIEKLDPHVLHFQQMNRSMGFTIAHLQAIQHLPAKKIFTCHLSSPTCNTSLLIYKGKPCSGVIKKFDCTNCCYRELFGVPAIMADLLTGLSLACTTAGINKVLPYGKIKSLLSVADWSERTKKELTALTGLVDKIVVVAAWYKDILLKNGVPENKIAFIAQTPVTDLRPAFVNARHTSLPLQIAFLGRVQHQKGVHLLLDAVKDFSAGEVQLYIYGKEEDNSYYRSCVEQSKGIGHIHWKGPLAGKDVIPTLQQHHALCLPSTTSEMSPLVIQEAFAAGIPVIASDNYGNREQVKDGVNGLLFDFNSSISLQQKIRLLVDEPSLADRLAKSVVSPPGFQHTVERYMELYV